MSVYRHCESASLLCGAAFLCTVEDVVNLLAGLRMFSYRTITLSEDATVTCAHSERLLVVQRVHNARAAVTCGGRSWLCTGFRESRRSEEAKAGGCGTGERAHWFLWCLSLSFSLSLWSTWMAGVSTMEAGIIHNHTCRDPHQGYITHMSHTDILMWGLRGSCSFKATLVFSRLMTLKWSNVYVTHPPGLNTSY